jgi:hypothetical protein
VRAALDCDGASDWRCLKCVDYARAEQRNGGEERLFDCLIDIHILGLPSFCSRSNF